MNVTVCTPTYNRAHILHRPFESLCRQTCKDFIWLVIDDGSSDNTEQFIEQCKKNADFKIEYYKKENGGRHTALNYSYQYIQTEWVINLDSDDELTENAIEILNGIIDNLPSDNARFWQISGRCVDAKKRELIGNKYRDDVNELSGRKQNRIMAKAGGEKSNCRRVSILKQYPFPVYEDTKFVTESTIWEKISLSYDSYCVNDVFRVYYLDSEDSLAKGRIHSSSRMRSRYYFARFCLNELFNQIFYKKIIVISIFNLARSAMCSGTTYKTVMSELNRFYKKIIVTIIGYPVAYLYILMKKEKSNIKKNLNHAEEGQKKKFKHR